MNGTWDLEKIYTGFDSEAYISDFARLEKLLGEFAAFAENLEKTQPAEGLKTGISMQEELAALVMKLISYAQLRQSANTRDREAGSQAGRILAAYSGAATAESAFKKWVSEIPGLSEIVEKNNFLRPYAFLLSNMAKDCRYLLPGRGEEIMARMQLSGGNAWSDLQSYLTSTVPVTYREETIGLPAVRNLAYDPDSAVRKDAYEAEIACYERIRDAVAFALNSIKLETISDCKLRGYASPLDRTLEKSLMKRETLEAMLSAMDDYLPKFWQYLKAKAKALGHQNGLPWYDLFAPMGKTSTKFTAEQARDYLVNLFAAFDSSLSQMVAVAFDNRWIVFYPREG